MRLSRAIGGVSLNGKEFIMADAYPLVGDDGSILEFPTEQDAFGWLAAQGILVYDTAELFEKYGITLEENPDDV